MKQQIALRVSENRNIEKKAASAAAKTAINQ